jgi:uncharacterized protein YeaO (DUF488 family)
MTTVRLKSISQPAEIGDGARVLVDPFWPPGISKAEAGLDLWLKEVAPSPELQQLFDDRLVEWREFRSRYLAELARNPAVAILEGLADSDVLTLVSTATEEFPNPAVVLAGHLLSARG